MKVGIGPGQIKKAHETSPANIEVFRAKWKKEKTVRQNQGQLALALQGSEQPVSLPWQVVFLSNVQAYLPYKGQQDSILPDWRA